MSLYNKANLILYPDGVYLSGIKAMKPTTDNIPNGQGDPAFSRSTTARRLNENGLLQETAVNFARADYSQGDCPSILCEPTRTNLFLYSQLFSNAAWSTKTNVTLTDNVAVAPDGTTTATRLVGTGAWELQQSISVTINKRYVITFYAKTNNAGQDEFQFKVDTAVSNIKGQAAGSGWARYEYIFTAASSKASDIGISARDSENSDILIWGAQLEDCGTSGLDSAFETSYIPTTTTTVTRQFDSALSGMGNANVFNSPAGVLLLELKGIDDEGISNSSYTAQLTGTSQLLNITYRTTGAVQANMTVNGSALITALNLGASSKNKNKIAFQWANNDVQIWANGTLVHIDTAISTFPIGSLNSLDLTFYGWLKNCIVFGETLTLAEFLKLTGYLSFTELATETGYTIY